MLVVLALHQALAERHHQLLAVVGELEDLLHHVVHHPDVLFRVVRTDFHVVRAAAALKKMIPLRPVLQQLAVGVHHENAILHPRLATGGRLSEGAVTSRVAFRRFFRNGKLAAVGDVNAIGCLGKNAALRAPGPSGMPERLRPAGRYLVRTGLILAAHLASRCALRLLRLRERSPEK